LINKIRGGYRHGIDWNSEGGKKLVIEISRQRGFGFTNREIARNLSLTVDQIQHVVFNKNLEKRREKISVVPAPLIDVPANAKVLLNYLEKGQELIRKYDIRQREVQITYDTKDWVGLVFIGDFHIDHYKTDLTKIQKMLSELGGLEDCFVVINGDVGDNSDIRFAREGYELPSLTIPVQLRYEIIAELFNKIPNLLVMTCGDHDDWMRNRLGFDMIESIVKKQNRAGIPTIYLGYGGFVNFIVGEIQYRMGIYHRYSGESKLNDFHPCMNFLRDVDATCDVVSIAHRHDKTGICFTYYQRIPRVLIRSGSEQYLTDYAWKRGFQGAINNAPMLLLNGTKKIMKAIPRYEEGLEELKWLNKK